MSNVLSVFFSSSEKACILYIKSLFSVYICYSFMCMNHLCVLIWTTPLSHVHIYTTFVELQGGL